MISSNLLEVFRNDSLDKQLTLTFSDGTILTNEDIYTESMTIQESLCSAESLTFGSCESSSFSITVANNGESYKGQTVVVKMQVGGKHTIQLGKYKVESDTPTANRLRKDLVAYDALYEVINGDATEWYNSLFPADESYTIKKIRKSFASYFGLTEESTTLVNDNIVVSRTIDSETISGKDILTYIGELNGVFPHINRAGKLVYISLGNIRATLYPQSTLYPAGTVSAALYPTGTLLPSSDVLPLTDSSTGGSLYPGYPAVLARNTVEFGKEHYRDYPTYEDFVTEKITGIRIKEDTDDEGILYGDTKNVYQITGNIFTFGQSDETKTSIMQALYKKIKHISYRPASIQTYGNPCIEVGDAIIVYSTYMEIETYVLQRTISGIQALKDEYTSTGTQTYEEDTNGYSYQFSKVLGHTRKLIATSEKLMSEMTQLSEDQTELKSTLTQTAEEISAEVKNVNESLSAAIQVNANAITQKVSKGTVSSEITQESDAVSIKANRFSWESSKSSLTSDGAISCSDISVTGGSIKLSSNSADEVSVANPMFASNRMSMKASQFTGYNSDGTTTVAIYNDSMGAINLYSPNGQSAILRPDSFTMSGTKSRLADTENYDKRLLYCYETPTPMFGDLGEGETDENGTCYIFIEDIFSETIDTDVAYQVFLQAYGDGQLYVSERNSAYFVVEGTPHIKFGWELKAIQKSYDSMRLENFDNSYDTSYNDVIEELDNYMDSLLFNIDKEEYND